MSRSRQQTRSGSSSRRSSRRADSNSRSRSSSHEEYEVDKIIDVRTDSKTKTREYLVKWKRFSIQESTWEPIAHLQNVLDIVEKFEKSIKKKETTLQVSATSTAAATTTSRLDKSHNKKLVVSSSKTTEDVEERRSSRGQSDAKTTHHHQQQANSRTSPRKLSSNGQKRRKPDASPSPPSEDESIVEIEQHQIEQQKPRSSELVSEEDGDSSTPGCDELVFDEILSRRDNKWGEQEYLVKFLNREIPEWIEGSNLDAINEEVKAFDQKLEKEKQLTDTTIASITKKEKISSSIAINNSNELTVKKTNNQTATSVTEEKVKVGVASTAVKKTAKRSVPEKEIPTTIIDGSEMNFNEISKAAVTTVAATAVTTTATSTTSASTASTTSQRTKPTSNIPELTLPRQKTSEGKLADQVSQRLKTIETSESPIGDFKTDNVGRMDLQGSLEEICSARFEVVWKQRADGIQPLPCFFSSAYLKRYEPGILIDFLLGVALRPGQKTHAFAC